MSTPVTLDSAGRIVLPSEVRRRLNLTTGSRLQLAVVAERIELTPEADAEPDFKLSPAGRKILKATGTSFDASAATRSERTAQARRSRGR